jgi:hypothetical protein
VPPSSTSSSRADNGCSAGRKNKNHPEGGVGRRLSREQSEVAIKLKPQILGAADGQPHASEVLRRMQSCYTTLAGVVPEASCDPLEASFDTQLHLFCGTYTRVGRGHCCNTSTCLTPSTMVLRHRGKSMIWLCAAQKNNTKANLLFSKAIESFHILHSHQGVWSATSARISDSKRIAYQLLQRALYRSHGILHLRAWRVSVHTSSSRRLRSRVNLGSDQANLSCPKMGADSQG